MKGKFPLPTTLRVLVLLLVYCVARLELWTKLDAPTFGWRPTDLAGIAINYYRNGFHFAYPQVMWGGAGLGHVEMEFPLQPFATAVLFKLFGLHDGLNVALPLAFGFGIVCVVSEFGRYLFGEIAGFAAGLNLALSPTLVYITSTGMWPDPPMVFFGTLGLYLLTRWSEGASGRALAGGVACVSLAISCKLTALYLGFPVSWLFIRRYGKDFWRAPSTWLSAAAMLVPPALWYAHAYALYLEDGNTFGILAAGYLKFPTLELLKQADIYKHALIRISVYHLTPIGFIAFCYGLYLALKRRLALPLIWFGAIVLHTFVVWAGIQYGGHIGYLLPILPICNLLAGLGFRDFLKAVREKTSARFGPRLYAASLGLLLLLVAVDALAAARRLNDRDLAFETVLWEKKKRTGLEVGKVTEPGSLIIVLDDEMDKVDQKHSMTPPDVFFFGDRRGWYLSLAWVSSEKIEELREKGAKYLVVSSQSVDKFETEHAELYAYLNRLFPKVAERDGIIYALGAK